MLRQSFFALAAFALLAGASLIPLRHPPTRSSMVPISATSRISMARISASGSTVPVTSTLSAIRFAGPRPMAGAGAPSAIDG